MLHLLGYAPILLQQLIVFPPKVFQLLAQDLRIALKLLYSGFGILNATQQLSLMVLVLCS